jgi:hypothetical protein
MILLIATVAEFLSFTGPDKQQLLVNPQEIVSIREPRVAEHFGKDIHCLIFTTDAKFMGVTDTCTEVERKILDAENEP